MERVGTTGQHPWERRREEGGSTLRVALRCNSASYIHFANEDF